MRNRRAVFALGLLCCALSEQVQADFTIRFDELALQPVDGLSFMGVAFGFSGGVGSFSAAQFGSTRLTSIGKSNLLQGPALEGSTSGALRFDFAAPVATLQFDVGLGTTASLRPGFNVALFDNSSNVLDTFAVTTLPADQNPFAFSEARFAYTATGSAIGRAVVTFDTRSAEAFALDNLIGVAVAAIPEPNTIALLGIGALTLIGVAHKRRMARTG